MAFQAAKCIGEQELIRVDYEKYLLREEECYFHLHQKFIVANGRLYARLGYIAYGKLTLLHGPQGVGKTMFLMRLMATATNYKSIHERLGEKKQQSAAKKVEKAVDKAVKKNKGQEL